MEIADTAVADFFRNIELVVDHGVRFPESHFLQTFQRVFDDHGMDFWVQLFEEVVP